MYVGKEMINVVLDAIFETAFEYKASDEEKEDFLHNLDLSLIEFVQKSMNPLRKIVGLFIPERRRAHIAVKKNISFAANFKFCKIVKTATWRLLTFEQQIKAYVNIICFCIRCVS